MHAEVSAFAIIVWRTYRNVKFFALVRIVVTQATIYFIAVVVVQLFVQVATPLGDVRPFSYFPWYITTG